MEIAEYDLRIAEKLAEAYIASGKRDDYIGEYEQLTTDNYAYPTNHFILGILQLDKANSFEYDNQRRRVYPDAIESFAITIAFGADEALSRYYLGKAYYMDYMWGAYWSPAVRHLDRYSNSIEHFEKAIELDPGFFLPYQELASIHLVMGNMERALKVLEAAVSAMPDNEKAIYWLGHFNYVAGNYEDAVSFGLHATQIDSKDPYAYGILGLAYEKLGERLLAIAMLRQGFNLGLPRAWDWYGLDYRDTLNKLTGLSY